MSTAGVTQNTAGGVAIDPAGSFALVVSSTRDAAKVLASSFDRRYSMQIGF